MQPQPDLQQTPPTVDKEEPFDLERYYDYIKITYPNKNTASQYRKFMDRIIPHFQNGRLTQGSINRFLTTISDNSSYQNPFYRGALKAITRCYPELRLDVPTIRSASVTRKKIKFLEFDEVSSIIRQMRDPQLKVMCRLYFDCGLRSSELLDMPMTSIDLAKREMTGVGKRNIRFTVRFSPQVKKWIEEYLVNAKNIEYPFRMYGKDGLPLRSQRSALDYRLKRETKAMGKRGIHCHQFRHSLGHFLRADKGFDIVQIKTKLRHSSIVSTEIYTTATEEEVDKKIDKEVWGVQDEEESP